MRREIRLLLLAELLIALGLGMLGPYYAIYVEKIANDNSLIGYSYAAFWLSVGFFSPLFGRFVDRKGRKIFLILGGFLAFLVSIGYSLVSAIYQLILLEIINGIATACFNPAYKSMVSELTSKKSKGFEYGLLDSVSHMAYGISALLATIILANLGLKSLFIFSGTFQLVSSIILTRKVSYKS
jgi:MFS transporter, DHA1 family, multidrug resistance protein